MPSQRSPSWNATGDRIWTLQRRISHSPPQWDKDTASWHRSIELEKPSRTLLLSHLSRLIAHLVPISTVPSASDKYPTSISVILVLPLSRIYVILFLRYSSFHVFHCEVPGSHPDMDEINQLQTSPWSVASCEPALCSVVHSSFFKLNQNFALSIFTEIWSQPQPRSDLTNQTSSELNQVSYI